MLITYYSIYRNNSLLHVFEIIKMKLKFNVITIISQMLFAVNHVFGSMLPKIPLNRDFFNLQNKMQHK